MNLFKFALKNLKMHKFRTIMIFLIMMVIVISCVIGLSIKSTAQGVSDEYRNQIGAEVNIEVDYDKVNERGSTPDLISAKTYQQIAKLPYVKEYSFLTEIMLNSKKIKAVGEDSQQGEDQMGIVEAGDDGKPIKRDTPKLKLIGGGGSINLPEFKNKSRILKQGAFPKKDNEVIISEELAKLNKLKVGDKISLSDLSKKITKEFTISGIYEDKTPEDGGTGIDMPIFNKRNEIITNFDSALSMDSGGIAQVKAQYTLKDPKDFEKFKAAAQKAGISDGYKISIDEESYNKAVGPIDNLNTTIAYFLAIILFVSVGILIILSLLAIKERQYEIGVLRAMGMKKNKVGLNFILESSIILLFAIVVGMGIGSISAKPIGNSLLQQQITAMEKSKEQQQSQTHMFPTGNSNNVKTVDNLDVKIDSMVMLQILGIGFVVVIISNSINIIYIMRFQPIEIMRSKN